MSDKDVEVLKLKSGFLLRKIGEERVLIPLYGNVASFNGLITLNDSSELLIKLLQNGTTRSELIMALVSEYSISDEVAKHDVDTFLAVLIERSVLEDG